MTLSSMREHESLRDAEAPALPESFRSWRSNVVRGGRLPIIGVAGLRGKTAVIHLLDHILTSAGQRTAYWSSNGVVIDGVHQESELGAWKTVMNRLVDGSVSVAFQELDAATVLATGLPADFYPVVAVTNICANDELCQLHREGQLAIKAMPRVLSAVWGNGALVANGEDFTLFDAVRNAPQVPTVLFALNRNVPLIRQHTALSGLAAWRDGSVIRLGIDEDAPAISRTPEQPFTLFGGASFQLGNVLAASSAALLMGVQPAEIERALLSYAPQPEETPGTMAVLRKNGVTIVIDRPDPSWFLRPVLRGIRSVSKGRLYVVAGRMESVPLGDIQEVGRMLGRDADALILFDHESDPSQTDSLVQGARRVLDPPLVARYPTMERAIEVAMRRMREADYLLVLTGDPISAIDAVRSDGSTPHSDNQYSPAAMEHF